MRASCVVVKTAGGHKANGAIPSMALDRFGGLRRWLAWVQTVRRGQATKVPYSPAGGPGKSNDSSTWGTRAEAVARAKALGGDIGIVLGDLDDGTYLLGLDLDSCLDDQGVLAGWAVCEPNG